MNIGILLYSYSGNTQSIAESIKSELESRGHTATIERITLINGDPNARQPAVLKDTPDVSGYDKLIIGAPINGFNLCKAMRMYLGGHAKIKAKDINCFVTQHFKHSFLGGNRGINQIAQFCKTQGLSVKNTAVVHWSSAKRAEEIANAAQQMAEI